jgi:HIRAN domain
VVSADGHDSEPGTYVPSARLDPHRSTFDGLPRLHLVDHYSGLRLAEDDTGLLVGPTDTRLPALGIWVDNLRGTAYRSAAAKAGDFRPGVPVRLVREPDNPHDEWAVAVYDATGRHLGGYFNARKAKRLAPLLDAGHAYEAMSLRGTGAGWNCDAIAVLAAAPHVMFHLTRATVTGHPKVRH